jgi:hypothetical protein
MYGAGAGWAQRASAASTAPKNWTDAWNPKSYVNVGAKIQEERHTFWNDVLPTKGGWAVKATSYVPEMAADLLLYNALSLAPEAAGVPLTARLEATPIGKQALRFLLAGGAGTAYGTATRPIGDKHNAWKNGVDMAILSLAFGVFDLKSGKRVPKTLKDIIIEDHGVDSGEGEAILRREEDLNLAQNGQRRANLIEQNEDFKKEAANNMAAAGVHGQKEIFEDALNHVRAIENESPEKIKAHEVELLKQDPAFWSPVLASANFIRKVLGNKKLGDLKLDSPEITRLMRAITQHLGDSAAEITKHVPEVSKFESEASAEEVLKSGAAKSTIDFFRQQIQAEVATAHAQAFNTPEQLEKLAQQRFALYLEKAEKRAAEELNNNETRRMNDVTQSVLDSIKKHRDQVRAEERSANIEPAYRERTRRGKNYVSYSIAPDYKVHIQAQPGAPKNFDTQEFSNWLAGFYDGLDDKDFAMHLEDNFYPQALKKADIWFEHQTAGALGHEYPNFLAFMRNYDFQMPLEMRAELEDRLVGTQKFQDAFRGGAKTHELLDYYTRGMYNHVDDFLGSGRWPNETNIFRSSFDTVRETTRYQFGLLKEKMQQEEDNLRDALSKYPEAQNAAIKNLRALQNKRLEAFQLSYDKDPNSRETVYQLNELITQEITKNKMYDRWVF